MSKWIAVLVATLGACSNKPSTDMPQSCFEALDCCSSLGRDLDDPELSDAKYACASAKRFADEGSGEKCEIAFDQLRSSFWQAYPSRSMGPTCEAARK